MLADEVQATRAKLQVPIILHNIIYGGCRPPPPPIPPHSARNVAFPPCAQEYCQCIIDGGAPRFGACAAAEGSRRARER